MVAGSEVAAITTTSGNTNGILPYATYNGTWAAVTSGTIGAYSGGYLTNPWTSGSNTTITGGGGTVPNGSITNSLLFNTIPAPPP